MIHALGHEDPRALLKTTLDTPRESRVTDIYELGPAVAHQLELNYGIVNVGQLLDYIYDCGFPSALYLKDTTKFVISYRIAHDYVESG